jgi:SAM-dependent methyltransferase
MSHHATLPDAPSPWIVRWAGAIAPRGTVLDVACGAGRHARYLAGLGLRVTAVDRDRDAVASLHGISEGLVSDLERAPWPFPGRRFDAVIVTNYLWRALMPRLIASVNAGGLLLYETFAVGQEKLGRPANPDFLLQPAELLAAAPGLHILAYEDGSLGAPPRRVQRIAAWRAPELSALPPRLDDPSKGLEFPHSQDPP